MEYYEYESSIFGILNNYSYISLIPENAVYIENKGYRPPKKKHIKNLKHNQRKLQNI